MGRVLSFALRCLVACSVVLLAGCVSTVTTLQDDLEPITKLSREADASGAWLASMPGAIGVDIQEFADGDLLLLGEARSSFVQRLSPDGEVRWTLPFAGCSSPAVARGDDEATYVAIRGLLAVGDVAVTKIGDKRSRCRALTPQAPAAILRVNGSGEVVWRWDSSTLGWGPPTLHPVADGVIVTTSGIGIGETPNPSSAVVKLSARREVVWEKPQSGTISRAGLSPSGRLLLGIEGATSGAHCSVRAVDASSGATLWETKVGLDIVAGTTSSCLLRQLSVTTDGSVIWIRGQTDALIGLDPQTGAQLWTRDIAALDGAYSASGSGRAAELALFVHWSANPEWQRGQDATLVGVESRSGHTRLLARLQESVPNYVASGPNLASATWGRRALLLTGSFNSSLTVRDLRLETSPFYSAQCLDIDPGFYIGPYRPPPPKPRLEQNPWRGGVPRVVCPSGTFKQRFRTFTSALFVAKLPLETLDRL